MVNNRGRRIDKMVDSIKEMMIKENYEEAKLELFKLNNSNGLTILDKYYALYTSAYLYDELGDLESAKCYIAQAINLMSLYSRVYVVEYNKVACLALYLLKDDLSTYEKLDVYHRLYKNVEHLGDTEENLNLLSVIYTLEDKDQELIDIFVKCLNMGYITTCKNILNNKTLNKQVRAEMQLSYNRKQEMVS